jgi:small subunit ribosomal protein S2
MPLPTLIELAEAGAHYGHHRSLTYPKAKEFVFMTKNNVSLINLEHTLRCLQEAQQLLHEYRAKGKPVLFVGTKRSIRPAVKDAAESINEPYIVERWYGGFLTNFSSFAAELKKMKELTEFLQGEKAAKLEKKERAKFQSRLDHYNRFLGGAADLRAKPELLVVASATEDKIAIGEARKLNIPVIAIVDTDINPDEIDYPIPANDDAPRAVELILKALAEAPVEAQAASKVSDEPEVPAKAEAKAKSAPKKKAVVKAAKKSVEKAEKPKAEPKAKAKPKAKPKAAAKKAAK